MLVAANFSDRFWPYAVHFTAHSAQLQQAKALGYPWDQPMFGESVAAWRLKAKSDHTSTEPRGTLGKLLQINYYGDGKTWVLQKNNAITAGLKP
eukprot:3548495-Amphidinium_carterae.2